MLEWLRELLTREKITLSPDTRRVIVAEDAPNGRFVLIVALMIVFFVGLAALEITHMLVFGAWNDSIFNGVMLIVGTIVGAVWGRSEG